MISLDANSDAVLDLIAKAKQPAKRLIIAIAGPPGSGKSTLAAAVVARLNDQRKPGSEVAALLPMDGFHLDNAELEQKGLLARKGAAETFDAQGLVRLLTDVKVADKDQP